MGYSTPKKPFDLGEFLSQKATARSSRKPTWQRRAPAEATGAEDDGADVPEVAPRQAE